MAQRLQGSFLIRLQIRISRTRFSLKRTFSLIKIPLCVGLCKIRFKRKHFFMFFALKIFKKVVFFRKTPNSNKKNFLGWGGLGMGARGSGVITHLTVLREKRGKIGLSFKKKIIFENYKSL